MLSKKCILIGKSDPNFMFMFYLPIFDSIQVGCWNGAVALFKFTPDRMHLLSFFMADFYAIRSVSWIGGSDPSSCHESTCCLYATSGHGGTIKFWNRKKPQQVVFQKLLGQLPHVMDMTLCKMPVGFLSANSDGSLKFLYPTPDGICYLGKAFTENCLLSVAANDEYFHFTSAAGETFLGEIQSIAKKHVEENGGQGITWRNVIVQNTTAMTLNHNVLSLEGWSHQTKKSILNPPQETKMYTSVILPCIPEWKSEVLIMHGSGSGLVRIQLLCNFRKRKMAMK